MTEDTSPENLRKFLLSEDPVMRLMGISMAKGADLAESNKLVMALSFWDSDKKVRESAKEMIKGKVIIDKEQAKKEGVGDWVGDEGILISQLDNLELLKFLNSDNNQMVFHACYEIAEGYGKGRKNDSSNTLISAWVSFLNDIFDKIKSCQRQQGFDPDSYDGPNISELLHDEYFPIFIDLICNEEHLEDIMEQIETLKEALEEVWDYNNGVGWHKDCSMRWYNSSGICPNPYDLAQGIITLHQKFWPESQIKEKICEDSYSWLVEYIHPHFINDEDDDGREHLSIITLISKFVNEENSNIYKKYLIKLLEAVDEENYQTRETIVEALETLGMSEEEIEELGYEY